MDVEERSYSPITEVLGATSSTPAAPHYLCSTINRTGTSVRKIPPADYILTINQFSYLSEAMDSRLQLFGVDSHYVSSRFEAGGYKWRLDLYPNGDIKRDRNAEGYISLYLILDEITACDIMVDFKLFIYNQFKDEYLTVRDAEGKLTRFNRMQNLHGFSRLIAKEALSNSANGYLVDNKCSFGAEIFVVSSNTIKNEYISTFEFGRYREHYTWKLVNFNASTESGYKSDVFSVANKNWVLEVFIKEKPSGKKHIVLRMHMICKQSYFAKLGFFRWIKTRNHEDFPQEGDLWIECRFRVKDQINGNHVEKEVHKWFHVNSDKLVCEVEDFMPLDDLTDESKGFLLNDTLIIDVEFDRIRRLKPV